MRKRHQCIWSNSLLWVTVKTATLQVHVAAAAVNIQVCLRVVRFGRSVLGYSIYMGRSVWAVQSRLGLFNLHGPAVRFGVRFAMGRSIGATQFGLSIWAFDFNLGCLIGAIDWGIRLGLFALHGPFDLGWLIGAGRALVFVLCSLPCSSVCGALCSLLFFGCTPRVPWVCSHPTGSSMRTKPSGASWLLGH